MAAMTKTGVFVTEALVDRLIGKGYVRVKAAVILLSLSDTCAQVPSLDKDFWC